VRTVEPDKLHPANPRGQSLTQEQLAAQAVFETTKKKVRASDKSEKSGIRKDKDSNKDAQQHDEACMGQAYSPDGHSEVVGEDSEGHVIDALA
jgi:hypothetical protein